jgi:hypothetical protein
MNLTESQATPSPRRISWKRKLLFTLVLVLLCWLVAELAFRLAGYDFEDPRRALGKVPPFYQVPTEPAGTFSYHRPANLQWQGRPLRTQLELQGFTDSDYDEEMEVRIHYDQDGFRNAPGMDDWSMVFVGDSFTELGHLPDQQLFTSIVAIGSGRTVKNLGTSFTGPLTHLEYLVYFGIAPGTRDAVLVFFEGNDLDDLLSEEMRKAEAARPGYRHGNLLDTHVPQRSLTRALFGELGRLPGSSGGSAANATCQLGAESRRVTVNYAPVEMQVGHQRWELMIGALDNWAAVCQQHDLRSWLLYLPCKHRVLQPFLKVDPTAHPALRAWQPGPLPDQLSRLCEKRQIKFVDATPALQQSAASGELPYNTVYDTHLNAHGSRLVGELMTRQVKK